MVALPDEPTGTGKLRISLELIKDWLLIPEELGDIQFAEMVDGELVLYFESSSFPAKKTSEFTLEYIEQFDGMGGVYTALHAVRIKCE